MNNLNNNDHRIINKYIKIFHIQKNNPGIIYWNKNGLIIVNIIKKLIQEKLKQNKYYEVQTAHLIPKKIWKTSGHWEYYKNYIFYIKKNFKLCLKPMNCLGHIEIFKNNIKSYKDLPMKISEFGICHRNEPSGSLYGLMRTKSFTQDDAHIFCTLKQIKEEIIKCIILTKKIYKIFKFKHIYVYISTRPDKYLGKKKHWNNITNKLINILNKINIKFKINNKEGAFYGPKIEFIIKDKQNKKWQCGTIQIDFNLSKKLKINYINKNNIKKNPIIIHRAILGSIERFVGILIEKNKGWLPIWLTPIQIVILNISQKNIIYCKKIFKILNKYNFIRSIIDIENKKINFKIRKYTLHRIPYIIICGDQECNLKKINIRNTIKKTNKQKKIKYIIKKIKNKTKKIFKGKNY